MQAAFLRTVLIVAYCALVIAPTPKVTKNAVYKVQVLDNTGKNMYQIVSFNKATVSANELWNKIYQIPFIVQRFSIPSNSIYIHLTIITPGKPHVKIDNDMTTAPNASVSVANIVVLLSVDLPKYNILSVTTNDDPTLVAESKSILLDFVVTEGTIEYPVYIWRNSHTTKFGSWSLWLNVHRICVKAYDHNGKETTNVELLKGNKQGSEQQLNTENGVIYIDSEAGVKHIVPLWESRKANKDNYAGVFRFTENTTKSSIFQKIKNDMDKLTLYSNMSLVEVHIEMIGIDNLVISENDENNTTSPVDFKNAIAVIFTVKPSEKIFRHTGSDKLLEEMLKKSDHIYRLHGLPGDNHAKYLPAEKETAHGK